MLLVIALVKLLPLTTNDAVTFDTPESGVMVIVEAEPVVGVASVIVHAYVGDVTFCVTAVSVAVDGVTVPPLDRENTVNPDISTKGPAAPAPATGFQTNDALIGLKVDVVISLPTK